MAYRRRSHKQILNQTVLLGKDNASATWTLSPAILQTKAKKGFLEHKADQHCSRRSPAEQAGPSHLPGLEADLSSHLRGPASAWARLPAGPGAAEVRQEGKPWKAARPPRRGFVLPGSPPPPATCAQSHAPPLQSGLGDGVASLLHFKAEEAAVLRGNSAPAVPQPASQCRRLVVPFLGQEDLLEGDMATHSPILARKQKSLTDYSP
ncbi:uncharacterized protein LOC114115866 [Ovis aries]|uniref:uncharacterized protein LOC114115866 n=1 Tax=Ovis aries TaxID=9940 RepID=UPI0029529228|nr:uncharacterized protein LOC114115866 [Ovis aries]